jgi:short-subunit dehydrogenase
LRRPYAFEEADVEFDYRDKVAIVTGASSGIGKAIALDLAKRGTTVVAVARRKDLLEEVAEECRQTAPRSEAAVADVADRAGIEHLCKESLARHGKVDLLVNNAGIPLRKHAARLTVEDVEQVMQINFFGAVYPTLALLPSMLERRTGHIVNVSSVAGRIGAPREAAYSASKYAMTGWSEVLSGDLQGSGVKVHLIIPGAIDTEIWQKVQEPAAYSGKFIPPQEIADAVREVIEHDRFERWVPRKLMPVATFRAVLPGTYIKNMSRYDRRHNKS